MAWKGMDQSGWCYVSYDMDKEEDSDELSSAETTVIEKEGILSRG
jgi:hypothetical protein